ncbi:MAG: protein translocase subunit SecF [Deltaproteobacteria bacterium]|nr:protein translocase subunit SecF [Deltaproteobacteria bacterium]
MFSIIRPGTNIDFIGKAPFFLKITLVSFILAVVVILAPGFGIKFGLDFSGGYEVLLAFDQPVSAEQVRSELGRLNLGDTSVQSFAVPDSPRTHYLVRVQRAQVLTEQELTKLNQAFTERYGAHFKSPVDYNPEVGNLVEVEFIRTSTAEEVDTSSASIAAVVATTDHQVRKVRPSGRPDQMRFSVVMAGVDVTMVEALRAKLDPSVNTIRVEFVGPTVGRQLRDDGLLAMFYALLCILIYIALRFDFFYGPGAIACVFHDAIITTGLLVVLGRDFNLTTIAGLLTLIGYSINDTIIVYDRIRETVGKAHGGALKDILNKSVNDTLGRTIMTSFTTFVSCVCLMIFGRNTVLFDYGLIMAFGVVIGTYSSIYVAAPLFMALRTRFGPSDKVTKGSAARSEAHTGAI